MRKNKSHPQPNKLRAAEKQPNQSLCRAYERSPVKRTAFHRIGGRKQ